MNSTETEREYLFDNIKGIMLFFVALGHTLDIAKDCSLMLNLMKYVYLFHMPMFAFVTGYFSKNLERARHRAVPGVLVPYLIVQTVYVAIAMVMINLGLASFNTDVFRKSILLPSSAFYYLLCVFFWKAFAKDIFQLRHPLFFSIIVGLLVSQTDLQDFHQGYGAVLSLLCFFTVGVVCTPEMIQKIRRIPKMIGVLVLLTGILPAVYLPYAIHSVRTTYAAAGFTPISGMLYRLIFYVIAAVMGCAFINLCPAKKTFLSQIGKSSIVVYTASTFLSPHGYVLLEKLLPIPQTPVFRLIAMCIYCAALVLFSSLPIFVRIFNRIVLQINKLLFKTV